MVTRFLSEEIRRTKKSVLLLGPRQVGKSTLIESLRPDLSINLADEATFLLHSSRPDELRQLMELHSAREVFIDEVQRLPSLLNTVQALIDKNRRLKFYLTGSSARKLKRGGANLLPGRVLNFKLGTLVASEMSYAMDTRRVLQLGALPEAYLGENQKDSQRLLRSYSANYLKEEIQAEALTRNLEAFSRFFVEAIQLSAQFVDLTKLAKLAKISRHAIPRYFEILEDTRIGHRVLPFAPLTKSHDLIRHPKFYLFDNGVYNGLLGNFVASQDRVGVLSEQLVFSQILHSAWAKDLSVEIQSFRTRKGVEVDFIAELEGAVYGIEVKNHDAVTSEDVEGLLYFAKAYPKQRGLYIFHMGTRETKLGPVWALPWQRALKEMGL